MCRVLIIEDEFLTALDIEALLAAEGATSFAFAHTEAEALAEAHRHPPDVIISDVTLREGDGPSAVASIRSDLGALPVLFVTATPDVCALIDPPCRVLGKPFDGRTIASMFRELAPL